MNKDEALHWLEDYLSQIRCHSALISELSDLIKLSGQEEQLFKQLTTKRRQLSVKGVYASKLDGFENIGGGLFSMRLCAKGYNIRILYFFLSNVQPVLLLAFYERGGKKKPIIQHISHLQRPAWRP